jgi:hypothetical protein
MNRTLVLAIVISPSFLFSSAQNPNYQVTPSDGTVQSPRVEWFDLGSVPEPARSQLLALYRREYALLRELDSVKWEALHDTLGGLFDAIASAEEPHASGLVEESAARAGQPGANSNGVNGALDAQSPVQMYESVNRAMDLLMQIGVLDKEITAFRKAHHIDAKLMTPWNKLFPKSKMLTPSQATALLTPAADRLVPNGCPMKGYAAGCLSSCMHVCNFGGPDAACQSKCQSDYGRQLRMERDGVAACIANAPK